MKDLQRQRITEAMIRLADGDRSAFTTVFEELWPPLLGFVRRAVHADADAEDVAQQALLKIFARIGEFDTGRDGVAWAFGIVVYEIRTRRRQVQRRREARGNVGLEQSADGRESPEQLVIRHDLGRALAAAVGELTPADRALLLAGDDAAQSSAISPAGRRKRRQRALERLRAAWSKLHG
jgi:RNA polymerase sigma-70 factor, ECF subfamily